jgi:hypothetical protein
VGRGAGLFFLTRTRTRFGRASHSGGASPSIAHKGRSTLPACGAARTIASISGSVRNRSLSIAANPTVSAISFGSQKSRCGGNRLAGRGERSERAASGRARTRGGRSLPA